MKDRNPILRKFAESIDRVDFGEFWTKMEEAKEKGIVVIYGESDDLCEMEGAISDETGCYGGDVVFINSKGFATLDGIDCDDEACPCFKYWKENSGTELKIIWNDKGNPCWQYEINIPHERFYSYRDGELFCEGIVFYADELK